jgi:putative FmdB family regulatory protein
MAIFEYRCLSCGKKLTLRLKQAGEKGPCPHCGGELQRIYSTFGIGRTEWESPFSDSDVARGVASNNPQALVEYGRRLAGGGPTGPEYREFLDGFAEDKNPPPPPREPRE